MLGLAHGGLWRLGEAFMPGALPALEFLMTPPNLGPGTLMEVALQIAL